MASTARTKMAKIAWETIRVWIRVIRIGFWATIYATGSKDQQKSVSVDTRRAAATSNQSLNRRRERPVYGPSFAGDILSSGHDSSHKPSREQSAGGQGNGTDKVMEKTKTTGPRPAIASLSRETLRPLQTRCRFHWCCNVNRACGRTRFNDE